MVKCIRQKTVGVKKRIGIGIDKFGILIELELINMMWNWN